MLNLPPIWEQLIEDLERERDELRLMLHLAKVEAREMSAKVDPKVDNVRLHSLRILQPKRRSP